MARTDYVLRHFPEAVVDNVKDHFALGGVACSFRKEIAPYEKYTLETRLYCFDEKWIYLQTRILGSKADDDLRAQSIAQYVLKRGRKTIKPDIVLEKCGYELSQPVRDSNSKSLEHATAMLHLSGSDFWQRP